MAIFVGTVASVLVLLLASVAATYVSPVNNLLTLDCNGGLVRVWGL